MTLTFATVPANATRFDIYGHAGEIFAEQQAHDRNTDYTVKEHYDKAIYYIAEKAYKHGFSALRGLTVHQIAAGIGQQMEDHRQFLARGGCMRPSAGGYYTGN
jgi:hypothetical protein